MSEFLNDENFENFRNLIYNKSGIHFSNTNRTILESRLKERLRINNFLSVKDYYISLYQDEEEMKILLDAVTTNLTRFFRNTAHFQTFENHVLPDLIKYKKDRNDRMVRLWSAGCSTGEEPYSLAMVLKDKLPPDFRFEVTGSDLSLKSLMTAKAGFYPDTRIADIPQDYLNRFFDRQGNGYQVKDDLKSLVKLDYHNLKYDSGQRNLDIVFCRNVLIYFDEAAQESVVNMFYDAMSPHSFLFIGHSESLFGMKTKFEFLKTDWACIYRKFV
jgi:chemotaxis protein methyltransferase CheR